MSHFTLSRRSVLAGATLLAGCTPPTTTAPPAAARKPVGIQLYTVRDAMAQDVPGTLRRIAEIGYNEVEFAGYFNTPPSQVRQMLADVGLSAPAAHLQLEQARDQPQALIDACKAIGHETLIIPFLAPEQRQTLDQYRQWADLFNAFAAQCRDNGLKFAYHNHDFEFVPIDGTVPYDLLLERCDAELVKFELDLYWATKAGKNPTEIMASNPTRFPMCHVKDMAPDTSMADVGAGTIDFAGIFAARAEHPFEHYFVERDTSPDPMATAAASYTALNAILNPEPA